MSLWWKLKWDWIQKTSKEVKKREIKHLKNTPNKAPGINAVRSKLLQNKEQWKFHWFIKENV